MIEKAAIFNEETLLNEFKQVPDNWLNLRMILFDNGYYKIWIFKNRPDTGTVMVGID